MEEKKKGRKGSGESFTAVVPRRVWSLVSLVTLAKEEMKI